MGPRAVYELLIELAARFGPGVIDRLEAYAQIDPAILRGLAGDRFPCSIHEAAAEDAREGRVA